MAKGYRQMVAEAEAEVETLDVATLRALLGDSSVRIVDVRDPRELERDGMIEGAAHCPRGMLEFWIDPESPYHRPLFAEDRQFVFYCAGGLRSALAAKLAQDMGLARVAHLGGGFGAWRDAGAPVVAKPGRKEHGA